MSKDFFYKRLLEHLFDGVYYVNTEKCITYWNASAEAITGFTSAEVIGLRCSDNILNHIDEVGNELCKQGCPLHESLVDGLIREANVYLQHKDGYRVPVSVRIAPVRGTSGDIIGALEVFQDNTEKLNILSELEKYKHMALIDPLTGVGNRKFAEMNIANRFAEMKRYGVGFGVLFVDVDHFKKINDKHGHEMGDKTLVMISKTLVNALRSVDVVCRWGGDEFLVIIPNVDGTALGMISGRLLRFAASSSFACNNETVQVTLSIGGTVATDRDTIDTLLRRSDRLMFQSKSTGRNTCTLDKYCPD